MLTREKSIKNIFVFQNMLTRSKRKRPNIEDISNLDYLFEINGNEKVKSNRDIPPKDSIAKMSKYRTQVLESIIGRFSDILWHFAEWMQDGEE